ncbi:hypothetical protein NA57DRAFT_51885 [Rhizodiscina lignyota]|uniref:Uncharacterized protein n=1 Tax=Rhizodiscina lignyota TaxID=1504668 RepID=A0A9P4IVD1_9PEZI|nr:hypothetical protein NA57DRAFT_51885 [Rhizodiscina lignyota]
MSNKLTSGVRRRPRRRPHPRSTSQSSQVRQSASTPQPRSSSAANFSHIQITTRAPDSAPQPGRSTYIPEDWEDEIDSQWSEDRAVFKTPSYQATTSEIGSASVMSAPPSQTPVRVGTQTFADMARSGVRLPGKQGGDSDAGSPAPGESSGTVKLKPSGRARGGKAWKPLDLSTIEDTPDSDYEAQPNLSLLPSAPRANTGKARATAIDYGQDPSTMEPGSFGYQAFEEHKHHVTHVFGGMPPPRNYLDETVGEKENEVRFAFHPNGNVSAHRWDAKNYFWEELGIYVASNRHVFGELVNTELCCPPGQTPQDNLEFFKLAAKQVEHNPYEDLIAKSEMNEMGATEPAPSMKGGAGAAERPGFALHSLQTTRQDFRSFSSAGVATPPVAPAVPTLKNLQLHKQKRQPSLLPSALPTINPAMEDPFVAAPSSAQPPLPQEYHDGQSGMRIPRPPSMDPEFRFPPSHPVQYAATFTQPILERETPKPIHERVQQEEKMRLLSFFGSGNVNHPNAIEARDIIDHFALQFAPFNRAIPTQAGLNEPMSAPRAGMMAQAPLGLLQMGQAPPGFSIYDRPLDSTQAGPVVPQDHMAAMRDYLRRIDGMRAAEVAAAEEPRRTVMNDPLQTGRVAGTEHSMPQLDPRVAVATPLPPVVPWPIYERYDGRMYQAYEQQDVQAYQQTELPYEPVPNPSNLHRTSIAEPIEPRRVPPVHNDLEPDPAKGVWDAASLLKAREEENRDNYKRTLNGWWNSGTNKVGRLQANLDALLAGSQNLDRSLPPYSPSASRRPSVPGPIQPPSRNRNATQAGSATAPKLDAKKDPMNLLLMGVLENLDQYRRDKGHIREKVRDEAPEDEAAFAKEQQDYFAKFGTPADEQRGSSRSGVDSFFEAADVPSALGHSSFPASAVGKGPAGVQLGSFKEVMKGGSGRGLPKERK